MQKTGQITRWDAERAFGFIRSPDSVADVFFHVRDFQGPAAPRMGMAVVFEEIHVGGAHAGYRIYPCADGRVAVAALEPHFAARLCAAAGLPAVGDGPTLRAPATHEAVANFIRTQTRAQLDALALAQDIPLHTLA